MCLDTHEERLTIARFRFWFSLPSTSLRHAMDCMKQTTRSHISPRITEHFCFCFEVLGSFFTSQFLASSFVAVFERNRIFLGPEIKWLSGEYRCQCMSVFSFW